MDANQFSGLSPFDIGFQLGMSGASRKRKSEEHPTSRMDGFSEDGLSYSVASDIPKMLGQTLAAYEARTRNPQGFFETPQEYKLRSNPELTQEEMRMLGGGRITSPAKTENVGGQLVRYNPVSGGAEVVWSPPPKPVKEPMVEVVRSSGIPGLSHDATVKIPQSQLEPFYNSIPSVLRTNTLNDFQFRQGHVGPYSTNTVPSAGVTKWVRGADGKITLSK